MDSLSVLYCLSAGSALWLSALYARSESYDRSVVDLLASFTITAIVLCSAQCHYAAFLPGQVDQNDQYGAIPLSDVGNSSSPRSKKRSASTRPGKLSLRSRTNLILVAIAFLTTRLELHRKITETVQCTSRSWEVLIPLALAVNQSRYPPRKQSEIGGRINGSASNGILFPIRSFFTRSRWRYIPPALAVTWGCHLVTGLWQTQNSTTVCPIVSGHALFIPRLQQLAVALDCLLAVIVQELARSGHSASPKLSSFLQSCGIVLFGTVLCWIAYGTTLNFVREEEMQWFLIHDTPSPNRDVPLILGQGFLASLFALTSLTCIFQYGAYQLLINLTAIITTFLGVSHLWFARDAFLPITSNVSPWSFIVVYLGVWSSNRIAQSVGQLQSSRPIWQILSFGIVLLLTLPKFLATDKVDFHPIEYLMFNAKSQHNEYIKYATMSKGLQSAVSIYRERYQIEPPPGFEKWYDYARNRSVLIMDDYDQIYRDLLPFRTISPADLRRQTWEATSNPWNEISGISIRDGQALVQENVLPTHRWMLEGVAVLINKFAQHLPDMDLAFNLNDESRVAVAYDDITTLRDTAIKHKLPGKHTWSPNRASTWHPIPKDAYAETDFENFSFQKNFQRFGSIGCDPQSLAVKQPRLSSRSQLCLQCMEPHSLGQFVSNWTLAADMCHQPDMSHLHGFYMSPAAFKTTHKLMPVFSQSKASGYNDILYPSSWNYMDKVAYAPVNVSGKYGSDTYSAGYPDPKFTEKENIMYWRGATSEGVSPGSHTWRSMTRQRLVHLMNNATSTADHNRVTILLPNPSQPESYKYQSLQGSAVIPLGLQQSTDVKMVDHIARCGGIDCTDQEKEFGLVSPIDFQAHWKYRFLFDMDGAGFSGRFLPFLQSRSLPFKTALFREWYDSRITAWQHFVPIDMRLHGVWSTLAYFAGVDGIWPGTGQKYKWEAHTKQAEDIAEAGRKWAGQVLRKEDMEVYFFRLLLEWGRLTDDRRDELGFSPS